MKTKKEKAEHSMLSNIMYFLKLLFSVSPLLVIGECIWGIVLVLPTRLISVLGVKYMIDVVASGENLNRLYIVVAVVAAVLIISKLAAWIFREFFWNVEKEKVYKGLNERLYKKAKSLDLESYDNPAFYNNFILTIESSSDNMQNILGLVRNYIGNVVSLITIASILLAIDPVCLLIILVFVGIFMPLSKKIGALQMGRRIDNTKFHRRSDYFQRIFYLQDYAKEVRMNNIRPILIDNYNDAADKVIENQKKYWSKISILYFIQDFGVQILGFMFVLPLYLGYCVLIEHSISAGDFVASFNGAYAIASSINFLTVWALARFEEQGKMIEKYREFLKTESKINDGKFTAKITEPKNIEIKNLSFTYPGNTKPTLKNINLIIEAGKVTAIVGASGSGKTTLLKLLLGFYPPTSGIVCIGEKSLTDYSAKYWRRCCGVVMQEGFIFSDSIAKNIGIIDEELDYDRLHYAARLANIDSFINSLPLGYETKIGSEGCGLSNGQKQRILIARAIYKNPNYIFLDEATNSLDTTNETIIMENLQRFYSGRTVVIVAHRLSTVRNADKIIVLHHGEIVEVGTHETLISHQGIYYQLIENQLELNKNV